MKPGGRQRRRRFETVATPAAPGGPEGAAGSHHGGTALGVLPEAIRADLAAEGVAARHARGDTRRCAAARRPACSQHARLVLGRADAIATSVGHDGRVVDAEHRGGWSAGSRATERALARRRAVAIRCPPTRGGAEDHRRDWRSALGGGLLMREMDDHSPRLPLPRRGERPNESPEHEPGPRFAPAPRTLGSSMAVVEHGRPRLAPGWEAGSGAGGPKTIAARFCRGLPPLYTDPDVANVVSGGFRAPPRQGGGTFPSSRSGRVGRRPAGHIRHLHRADDDGRPAPDCPLPSASRTPSPRGARHGYPRATSPRRKSRLWATDGRGAARELRFRARRPLRRRGRRDESRALAHVTVP